MKVGDAHLYDTGVLHSPRREGSTRLLRIEGMNMERASVSPTRLWTRSAPRRNSPPRHCEEAQPTKRSPSSWGSLHRCDANMSALLGARNDLLLFDDV